MILPKKNKIECNQSNRDFVILVEVYREEEVNQLPMRIEYIFPRNFAYGIRNQRLELDSFDLRFHGYILEYWKRFHRPHWSVGMVSKHSKRVTFSIDVHR